MDTGIQKTDSQKTDFEVARSVLDGLSQTIFTVNTNAHNLSKFFFLCWGLNFYSRLQKHGVSSELVYVGGKVYLILIYI